jgi:hypothetical protein
LITGDFVKASPNDANVDLQPFVPILAQENRIHAPGCITRHILWRSNMLALMARWAHNVLLAATGLLTIALVVWAT